MKLLILDHCAGAALEDPKDCRPYEAAPNNAHPSKSKIAREFDEGICEIYLHFFFYFYILANSSIWPCQIQNSEFGIRNIDYLF